MGKLSESQEKYLIVNADEFGLTEQVNRGIVEAHRGGIVTSATLITNMWAFEDAISLARMCPSLGTGVHLNFTDGSPLMSAGDVPTLVDPLGRFLGRGRLVRRLMAGKIKIAEVRKELSAQIRKVMNAGIKPSHLDSHQSTFMFPTVFRAVLDLASEHRLPIRLPREQIILASPTALLRHFTSPRLWKKAVMWCLSTAMGPQLRHRGVATVGHMVSTVGCFDGVSVDKVTLGKYELILDHLRPGTTELMTHPGYSDERLAQFAWGGWPEAKRREQELAVLCDPRLAQMLASKRIKLTNYRMLPAVDSTNRNAPQNTD